MTSYYAMHTVDDKNYKTTVYTGPNAKADANAAMGGIDPSKVKDTQKEAEPEEVDSFLYELDEEVGFCYVEGGKSSCPCTNKEEVAGNAWNCVQPPSELGFNKYTPLITARRIQIIRAQLEGATPEEKEPTEKPFTLKKDLSVVNIEVKKSAIKLVSTKEFDLNDLKDD